LNTFIPTNGQILLFGGSLHPLLKNFTPGKLPGKYSPFIKTINP